VHQIQAEGDLPEPLDGRSLKNGTHRPPLHRRENEPARRCQDNRESCGWRQKAGGPPGQRNAQR
jgi:hypothetical protein